MAAAKKRTSQGEALRKEGAAWIDRIKAATKSEKHWMDDAEKAVQAYTGERGATDAAPTSASLGDTYDFNILFSNVETIVPAVINSPPAPDIRRRFSDDDPAAKDVSELLERAIRIQIDDSKLQVEMEAEAQDTFLAGRGIVRLRFKSDFVKDTKDELGDAESGLRHDGEGGRADEAAGRVPGYGDAASEAGPHDAGEEASSVGRVDGLEQPTERLTNERITFEAISWRDYRHGPAKRWDERPWEAFRFSIPREDEDSVFDGGLISSQHDENDYRERTEKTNDLTGWEIWNKKTRKVIFVDDDGCICKRIDDPLELTNFYCIATPAQAVEVTGRLMPVNPFSIYRKLADELDLTTKRINLITAEMKVKGWYGISAADLRNIVDAKDGEYVPIADAEIWAANGGLAGAIAFWPIEKFVTVLRELYVAREQTKQAIYEITGISDIVRGASDSQETLGAQQIKTQWGSLRIQKMQRMLERTARDLFVMMAEIIPAKFSHETLQQMTGIQLIPTQQDLTPVQPPPAPPMQPGQEPPPELQQAMQAAQEAEKARQAKLAKMQGIQKLLNEPLGRLYRIDVESDSTVKADLSRQKAESAEFLQGAAAYFAAVGPLVQEGALPMDAAVEIFAANARMFNLGKSVEDTLDKMITDAKAQAGQPKPDPEAEKAKAEMAMKQQDAEQKKAAGEQEMGFKREEHGMKMQELQANLAAKEKETALKMRADKAKAASDAASRKDERSAARVEAGLPDEPEADEPDIDLVEEMTKQNAALVQKMGEFMGMVTQALTAPKRIVKDDNGRPMGVETVMQ